MEIVGQPYDGGIGQQDNEIVTHKSLRSSLIMYTLGIVSGDSAVGLMDVNFLEYSEILRSHSKLPFRCSFPQIFLLFSFLSHFLLNFSHIFLSNNYELINFFTNEMKWIPLARFYLMPSRILHTHRIYVVMHSVHSATNSYSTIN